MACAPYRARTIASWRSVCEAAGGGATGGGKDGRGVGYAKGNAIAGRSFASWAALEAHLACWMREVADVRVHGTTGEAPIARFQREEVAALRPFAGRPPFRQLRELTRRVHNDGCVDVAHLCGIVAGGAGMPGADGAMTAVPTRRRPATAPGRV